MISILIPTFNDDCVALAHAVTSQCRDMQGLEWELIVGDDGSTDQTWNIITEWHKKSSNIKALKFLKTINKNKKKIKYKLYLHYTTS